LPFRHDVGPIGQGQRIPGVVIRDQDADALLPQAQDDLLDVADMDGIDARQRLIEQHEGRVAGQRPGDLYPSPLPSGERDPQLVAKRRDMQLLHQLLGPPPLLPGR